MDTTQWPQGTGVSPKAVENSRPAIEKKPRPEREQALNCPRCNSTNTKFCYYNNYSLSQPRYFCKTCRRYWTDGGSLRSVPVGGGTRRNKRSSSSSPSSVSSKKTPDPTPQFFYSQNPKIHDRHDLNLAYPPNSGHYNGISEFVALPFGDHMKTLNPVNPNSSSSAASSPHIPVMEFLKTGITSRGLASTFMPMPVLDSNSMYSSRFPLNEFKPTLNFTLDGLENSYENMQGVQDHSNSRLLFPFEDLKPVAPTELEPDRAQGESHGYWNGMLAGGSW